MAVLTTSTNSPPPPGADAPRFWLREAAPDDAPAILRIIHAAYAEFQDQLDPPSGAHTETEATIRSLFSSERCVLGGWGDEAVGCTFFRIGDKDTYLHRLGVVPLQRRKAIGHALVTYVETQARRHGSPRVRLGVRLQLPTNQVFYRNLGYSVTSHHSHPGYTYPTYVSMTKDVSEPPQRLIEVVAPDPAWPRRYTAEAELLRLVFGAELVDIYHIGSTSIPGIYAKPIIDMLPAVRDIAVVESFNPILDLLGYQPKGEFGLPGRRYFYRGETRRTHQAHVYQWDSEEVTRHVAFRDYLRTHPEKARIYSDHKRDVARRHPYDIYAYMEGKDALVKQLEAEAMAWRTQGGIP